ncbi:MAG: tRNA epoxyqueuosine(34) reductase QueG [Gemmatimonadetes bacterium]|nr:tRNA epoxyqueuosine(34) reductase QueG [Gemmatimonadota bacterium]
MSRAAPPGFELRLKTQAAAAGFDLAGIATLGPPETTAHFDAWLDAGHHGEMGYMARGAELRRDARRPVEGMVSALVVALNYGGTQPPGPVARYARFADYHRVMWDKLDGVLTWVRGEVPDAVGRSFVDSGPVLERDLARRAGLGWFGKNTLLIHPKLGSFFFLGALFLDLELEPDAPFATDHCGACTRCLEACPTQAIVAPHVVDARRCISYLTIELKGDHTDEQAVMVGDHLFGCDICQEVCPWNVKFSRDASEPAFAPRPELTEPDIRSFGSMDDAAFKARYGDTPLARAKRAGMQRNAAAVGNGGGVRNDPTSSHQ